MERYSQVSEYENRKCAYLSKLNEVQEYLSWKNIHFRIIGSLARYTYTNDSLDHRRVSRLGYQSVPDIDLIIPRRQFSEIEQYKRELLHGDFPIEISLAPAKENIDFRPDQEYSYLTHRKLKVPVETALFRSTERYI